MVCFIIPSVSKYNGIILCLGTMIIVSHDRIFLDAVATEIIHFYRYGLFLIHHFLIYYLHLFHGSNQLKYYPGNYTAFEKAREGVCVTFYHSKRNQIIPSLPDLVKKKSRIQEQVGRIGFVFGVA